MKTPWWLNESRYIPCFGGLLDDDVSFLCPTLEPTAEVDDWMCAREQLWAIREGLAEVCLVDPVLPPEWHDGAMVFCIVLAYVMPRGLRAPEPDEWGIIEQFWAMAEGLA